MEELNLTQLTKAQLKEVSQTVSVIVSIVEKQCEAKLNERDKLIMTLGNFLYEETPIDSNEDNNPIIFQKEIPNIEEGTKLYDHIELGRMLGFVDYDNGIAISGNRGYFLTGLGVKLNQALINYALDFLSNKGY